MSDQNLNLQETRKPVGLGTEVKQKRWKKGREKVQEIEQTEHIIKNSCDSNVNFIRKIIKYQIFKWSLPFLDTKELTIP